MSGDDELDALIGSVSDDTPIDWNQSDAFVVGQQGKASVRALRDVARIAEFSRRLQRTPSSGAPAAAAHPDSKAPERWGDLTLLEPLGAGARGEVWRAWDARLRREVALKFLKTGAPAGASSDRALSGRNDSSESRMSADARLLDEARALARVRHPAVVTVHGIAEHDGRTGMWMEHLRGTTLAEEIERRGKLSAEDVARIGLELCRALAAVDAAGLVHRDLKPSNVILESGGRVVLTDFGLGQRRAIAGAEVQRASGTPAFMAPELLEGAPATARSDLYALGVTLRWALTGRAPFRARTLEELTAEARVGPPPLARERPSAPTALVAAIDRAMAPDPERRFVDALQMAQALEGALDNATPSKRSQPRRARSLAIAAVALVAVTIGTWITSRGVITRRSSGTVETTRTPQAPNALAPATAARSYDVEATLVDRNDGGFHRLAAGDEVAPGDRLSLEFHASRPMWVYVLNQDEHGQSFLLFPQPLFDMANPIASDSTVILPGSIRGRENAWTVTSRGGREHFLVVASPEPVAEIESELARLPAASLDRPIQYASIEPATVQRLRGVGGVAALPPDAARRSAEPFEQFQALAGRERVADGIWVRRITLENPDK